MDSTRLARHIRTFNQWATVVWLLLGIPTFLWWQESLIWIVAMSWWANVASHFAAWIAARADVAAEERANE